MIITGPNGEQFEVENLPKGVTKEQVERRMRNKYLAAQQSGVIPAWMEAGGRAFATKMMTAAGEIPDLAVTAPMALANQFVKTNTLGAVDMKEQMEGQGMNVPDMGQQVFPSVIDEDATLPFAAAQKAGDLAGYVQDGMTNGFGNAGMIPDPTAPAGETQMIPHTVPFQDAVDQQYFRGKDLRGDHPIASTMGDATGLAATMQLGRNVTGLAKHRAIKEADGIQVPDFYFGKASAAAPAMNASQVKNRKEAFEMMINSKGFKTLANRAGRATEAGFEGYVAGLLNDGDPVETAAYSAGLQASGSVLLTGLHGIFDKNLTKAGLNVALAAAGVGAIHQMVTGVAPGDQNFVLDSMDSGFDKVMFGIAAGLTAGAAGYGRVGKDFPVRLYPELADALSAMPRGAVLGLITEMQTDPDVNAVVRQLGKGDPDFFTSEEIRVLGKAQISKDPNSMRDAIEYLSGKRGFREKLESLR